MSIFSLENKQNEGVPQIFLHGFMGRPSMWGQIISQIKSPSALLTLPGHGPKPWFPKEDSFLGAIHEIASQWPFSTPAALIGYSMGSRVALGLALLYPEKVASALLIGVDPGLTNESNRAQRISWDEEQATQIENNELSVFAEHWSKLPLFATQEKIPEAARLSQQKERREHTTKGIAWAMRTLGLGNMPSWWPRLASCRVPLQMVTGALDQKFTSIGKEMSRYGTHIIIPNVGHNVALEAPEEIVRIMNS
jgi:2-succinyl-6-hydroxy-2,4-cyclohexadiene-1-carboxylate synthase